MLNYSPWKPPPGRPHEPTPPNIPSYKFLLMKLSSKITSTRTAIGSTPAAPALPAPQRATKLRKKATPAPLAPTPGALTKPACARFDATPPPRQSPHARPASRISPIANKPLGPIPKTKQNTPRSREVFTYLRHSFNATAMAYGLKPKLQLCGDEKCVHP